MPTCEIIFFFYNLEAIGQNNSLKLNNCPISTSRVFLLWSQGLDINTVRISICSHIVEYKFYNEFKSNTVEILDSGEVQGTELINYVCPFFENHCGGFFVHWQIQ